MVIKKSENKAKQLLEILDIGINDLPIPVRKIVKECEVKIKPYDLGENISGVLVLDKGLGTIGYNPFESKVRQRFTIAHELGHFLLHRKHKKQGLFVDKDFKVHFRDQNSATGEDKQEQEANAFAAALLMPADLLLTKIRELHLDLTNESTIKELAKLFDVSPIAMAIRISNLQMAFI